MTQQPVNAGAPVTDQPATTSASPLGPGEKASLGRVLRDQRKATWVALVLAVASFWILGQIDRWQLATCITLGVLLGLANHVATELWLLRLISSGEQPTRNKMIAATLVRLGVLTVVAVAIAVVFWPDGVGLLLGLAVFRLIALTMTSMTLLKELKQP
jgi:hypothetical protein